MDGELDMVVEIILLIMEVGGSGSYHWCWLILTGWHRLAANIIALRHRESGTTCIHSYIIIIYAFAMHWMPVTLIKCAQWALLIHIIIYYMYYNDILSKTSDFLKPHDRHILTCYDWSLPLSVQVVSTQYSGSLTLFPIPARHTRRALRQGRYCQMRHFSPSAAVNLTFVTNTFISEVSGKAFQSKSEYLPCSLCICSDNHKCEGGSKVTSF